VSETIRVLPEHLVVSGCRVAGHAEDVQITHSASDARIDSALSGWVGSSAAAMAAKAAGWQGMTEMLSGRLADHASALHASVTAFQETEDDNIRAVSAIGDQAARGSLGSL
jgi:WXG100 family type VII secretion target